MVKLVKFSRLVYNNCLITEEIVQLKMVEDKIENILKKIAESENIIDYELFLDDNALRGDGFLSDFYTGEVLDKSSGSKIQTYIKTMPTKLSFSFCSDAFYNENRFYSTIYSRICKFQSEKGVKDLFQNIPRFYCGSDQDDFQYVAMENLKVQKYVLFDKAQPMNEEHLKTIFKIYGRFHALGFAFKDQNMEEYLEMMKPLKNSSGSTDKSTVLSAIEATFRTAYKALKDNNEKAAEKIKPYVDNIKETYAETGNYKGKYSTIIHGDCWSNNMLFKYKENGQIEDIKLLDFQFCRDSTPIHDLSYFFYSGASKEDLDKLDQYLEIYHQSFSCFAKELGSDPEKVFPLSVLKSEWKNNSLFGIFLGILVWQVKLTPKNTMDTEQMREDLQANIKIVLESPTFRKNTSDILIHAIEYGIF